MLLGIPLENACAAERGYSVRRLDDGPSPAVTCKYGFVWVCLGSPQQDVVHIAEAHEPDRFVVTGGPIVDPLSAVVDRSRRPLGAAAH
jgi:phenylpropionate dioxygenase-like ring-hydroxylating dioxygenase large terminal subunit